jgi:phage baseplate assembly protein W
MTDALQLDGAESFPQVGRGWRFPVSWTPDGRLEVDDGERLVVQAIVLIVRTAVGSRVMRPEFGAGIDDLVFEPGSAATLFRAEAEVRRALLMMEPRIYVDSVTARFADERLEIALVFRIDRHRRPTNLVLPFADLAGAERVPPRQVGAP